MSTYPTVRPSLTLDFQKSKQLDPRISFSRTSSATYVEGGVIKYADEHQARFEDKGLLMEESRTNAVLYSEDFQNQWSVGGGGSGGSATNSQTVSPDGNNTGAKFAAPATRYLTGTTTESGMPNTAVRFNLAAGTFDSIITGSPDSYDIAPAGNGWYRCKLRVSNLTCSIYAKKGELDFIGIQLLNSSFYLYALNSTYNQTSTTDGIYVWGAQLEAGSFPTSYIPTAGSTVTRAADIAQITGDNFSSWYNQGEGSFIVSADRVDSLPVSQFTVLTTNGFRLPEFLFTSSGNGRVYNNLTGSYITPASLTSATFGGAFDSTGISRFINGAGTSVSSTSLNDTNTALYLGNWLNNATLYRLTGHISRLAYYSRRLTDSELQTITL